MTRQTSPRLITIPSSDEAFQQYVARTHATAPEHRAADLERRLRRIFPRVIVRERSLSAEPVAWYVYRDGGWMAGTESAWWARPGVPRVRMSLDGWLSEATPTAAGLLGIDPAELASHHFTDFVVPGTLDDSVVLFGVIEEGSELNATILLRPIGGQIIAVELRAARDGESIEGWLRLAEDVDFVPDAEPVRTPASITTDPNTDVAFRAYVLRAAGRMPEPTPEGLALRLRRLYPHASVAVGADGWVARRDAHGAAAAGEAWWQEPDLPRVRYDAQALILDANEAAKRFFGHDLRGHHWQEFVTPGSTEQVTVMLDILAEAGAAESRFRMPRADGTLVEFDSYTVADGDQFTTVFRPANGAVTPAPHASATAG
jgi:hypothetical protein